jgi:hypothetical protein
MSKFRNVFDQFKLDLTRRILVLKLWEIARYCRHDETGRYRLIGEIRKIAIWSGPCPQLGYFKRLLYGHRLYVPTEWREQVKELVAALKALDAAQISLMSGEMFELLMPLFPPRRHSPPALANANEKGKKGKCVETESTDSDSYSTY